MIYRYFVTFHELARFLDLCRIPKEDVVYIGQDQESHHWVLLIIERK